MKCFRTKVHIDHKACRLAIYWCKLQKQHKLKRNSKNLSHTKTLSVMLYLNLKVDFWSALVIWLDHWINKEPKYSLMINFMQDRFMHASVALLYSLRQRGWLIGLETLHIWTLKHDMLKDKSRTPDVTDYIKKLKQFPSLIELSWLPAKFSNKEHVKWHMFRIRDILGWGEQHLQLKSLVDFHQQNQQYLNKRCMNDN
jgi:hypothetical protein